MKITFFLLVLVVGLVLFSPLYSVAQRGATQSQEAKAAEELARKFYEEGRNLTKQKKYREAVESYTSAIGLNPDEPSAYVGRGNAKLELKRYQEAIADYNKAIRIYSAQEAEDRKKVEDAKAKGEAPCVGCVTLMQFEEVQTGVSIQEAYNNRGVAKDLLGDKVGACKDFREACKREYSLACGNLSKVCNDESSEERTTPSVSRAQRQSVSSGLEGTKWQAIHPGEIYSPILDRSLSRQFFCSFEKQGKVSCSIIARASSKIKNEQYYDPIERRVKYRQVLIPSVTLPEENRVGTYKQDGDSIQIELSAYEIEATIQGDSMEGNITFKLESSQKARWVAKRIKGGN